MAGLGNRILSLFKRQDSAKGKANCPHCVQPSGHMTAPRTLDYPKEKPIRRVFITEGCMICNACVAGCPEVFKLDESKSVSVMSTEFTQEAESYFVSRRDGIEAAALGCCVSVIGIEYEDGSFSPMGTRPRKLEHVVPDREDLPPLKVQKD